MLQDEIVHLPNANGAARCTKLQSHINRIEKALASFQQEYRPLEQIDVHDPVTSLLSLEFLATRILALEKGSAPRHGEQVLSDARQSCILLLLAEGNKDPRLLKYYTSFRGPEANAQTEEQRPTLKKTQGFGSGVFDVFSIPAFFVLLNRILSDPADVLSTSCIIPDLELLRGVSMAFAAYGDRLQSNNYHRKTGYVFGQVLSLLAMTNGTDCNSIQVDARMPGAMEHAHNVLPVSSTANPMPGLAFDDSMAPPLPGTSLTWDQWLSEPSMTLGSPSTNLHSFTGDQYPDFTTNFDFLPGGADTSNEAANHLQLNGIAPSPATSAKKRRRTGDKSQNPLQFGGGEGVRSPEIPFHLIS